MDGKQERSLSVLEYLEVLQREYLVADLRRRIYPKPKDKNYFTRVMDRKRKRIEDIASRNKIPTIFSSDQEMDRVREDVYGPNGYPQFTYRDLEEEQELKYKDFKYYYRTNSDVRIQVDDQVLIGKLIDFVDENIVEVKVRKEENSRNVALEHITRIL